METLLLPHFLPKDTRVLPSPGAQRIRVDTTATGSVPTTTLVPSTVPECPLCIQVQSLTEGIPLISQDPSEEV